MLADRVRMSVGGRGKWIDRTTPTLVINQAYSTEGNGGRKLVRLDNGWLVVATKNPSNVIKFYVSKNNGETWMDLCQHIHPNSLDFALVSSGNYIFVIVTKLSVSSLLFYVDVTLITGYPDFNNAILTRDFGGDYLSVIESNFGNCSLAINPQGTELHACWSSKNSTYPNSFNIRYCKGTINSNGSVTWGSVEQVSKYNTITIITYGQNPNIVLNTLNEPLIMFERKNLNSSFFISVFSKTTSWVSRDIYVEGTYLQLNPSSCVDKNGVIHVVWNRQTTTSTYYIAYSKSIDGGVTWITPINIEVCSSNSKPSIAVNTNNRVFVEWDNGGTLYKRYSDNGGVNWVALPTMLNMTYPSLLDDNTLTFEEPLGIYMTSAGYATYPNSVVFKGKWKG